MVSVSGTTSMRQGPPPAQRGEDPMKAVAEKLNLSPDDLRNELRGGRTLNDVADAQKVPRDDLAATLRANRPADPTGRSRSEGPPPGGPKGELSGINSDETKLNRVSSLLDTDAGEVSKVNSASELVKMFQDKGVDLGTLRSVLNNGDLLDVTA